MRGDDQTRTLVNDYLERRIGRRQFLERAVGLGFSLSAASALLAACGGGDEEAAPATGASAETGGTATGAAEATGPLRLRILNDIISLDPATYPAAADEIAMFGVYEGLVRYKPGTWEQVNQLAETFEPSADGLQLRLQAEERNPVPRGLRRGHRRGRQVLVRAHRRPDEAEGRLTVQGRLVAASPGGPDVGTSTRGRSSSRSRLRRSC